MIIKKTQSFKKIITSVTIAIFMFSIASYFFYKVYRINNPVVKKAEIVIEKNKNLVSSTTAASEGFDLSIFENLKFTSLKSYYPENSGTSTIKKGKDEIFNQN